MFDGGLNCLLAAVKKKESSTRGFKFISQSNHKFCFCRKLKKKMLKEGFFSVCSKTENSSGLTVLLIRNKSKKQHTLNIPNKASTQMGIGIFYECGTC